MRKKKTNIRYVIEEVTDSFVRGRINLDDVSIIHNSILKEVADHDLEDGLVGGEADGQDVDLETRQSEIFWLTKSKKAQALSRKLVGEINDEYFGIDIDKGNPPDTQYTVYRNPDDHYDWHQDHYDDESTDGFLRTLSLSICLSPTDFYEGAEFFIKDGSERNVRVFKMHYGEFIVFPSDVEHKVNALRAGERESLVIWYGLEE